MRTIWLTILLIPWLAGGCGASGADDETAGRLAFLEDEPSSMDSPQDDDSDSNDAGMDDDSDSDTDTDDDAGSDPEGRCVDVSDCRFAEYNLDVDVGDRFVLSNLLERCVGEVGTDVIFTYEDNETWNLEAFNSNQVVTITADDLAGGNHGEGEYRVFLEAEDGEELDHATIRIDHGDSVVRPSDAEAPAPFDGHDCGDDDDDSDSNGGDDHDGGVADSDSGCPADCL